jgi:hypothetical protein
MKTTKSFNSGWALEGGRKITLNGKEAFFIHRSSESCLYPVEADAMAHYVVNALNSEADFSEFYNYYMKTR